MSEARILLVEDEPKLVRLVREVLTATDYEVLTTNKGATAIELAAIEQPDLMLLDLVLTDDVDGFAVARRVREFSDLPIIMLTAKSRESDVLRGFDVGADDYITKPFSSKELLARVRALLKRARHEVSETSDNLLVCGDLTIDFARRRASKDGKNIHLTRTEYDLLYELASHPNQVLLHERLLTAVWGAEYRDDLDYLRAYIRYLRRKLEDDPANPRYILTSPGVGYMLECVEK
jgi:two-component system KDP operon response regulator KdpE